MQKVLQIISPFKKIFLIIFLCIAFLISQVISLFLSLITKIFTDMPYIEKFMYAIENDTYQYLKMVTELMPDIMFWTFIIWLIPILLFIKYKKITIIKKTSLFNIYYLIFLGISLNAIISYIISFLPSNLINNYSSSINYVNELSFISLLLSTGIMAPILEELIFRFLMMKPFKNKKLALIITSLAFGIMHLNVVQSTYAIILGLVLGYFYIKSDNILLPIILHMTINTSSVFALYLDFNQVIIISLICVIFSIILTIYHYLEYKKKGSQF